MANERIFQAVTKAIQRIDAFISEDSVTLPAPQFRHACDRMLHEKSSSARTAALFLMFYWLEDPAWTLDTVPVGIRGGRGDKLLCEELSQRHVTLHNSITAFGENLGWKGGVRRVNLLQTDQLGEFLRQVKDAPPRERNNIADYLAHRFAESKVELKPLPPVGDNVLTFVRAKSLFYKMVGCPSEGHIQQFLIAALLHEYRRRHSIEVLTHHPHAADKFDNTAGDIEEKHEGRLIRAYEVTVRPDWQNRISGYKNKMDQFGLSKYVIIAIGINDDDDWSEPARMALRLKPYGRDIAVVDIRDVVNFLAAELTASELRAAVNTAYAYLADRKLSGREDFKTLYRDIVSEWLDGI
ncbi:MAG: hypothetical protein ACYC3X_27870 [Pirellulaceae bacterium]